MKLFLLTLFFVVAGALAWKFYPVIKPIILKSISRTTTESNPATPDSSEPEQSSEEQPSDEANQPEEPTDSGAVVVDRTPSEKAPRLLSLPMDWQDLLWESSLKDTFPSENCAVGVYFSNGTGKNKDFVPLLQEFYKNNRQNFQVLFVNLDKYSTVTYEKIGWPSLQAQSDAAIRLVHKFNVTYTPFMLVLGPKGNVITKDGYSNVKNKPERCIHDWLYPDKPWTPPPPRPPTDPRTIHKTIKQH